MYQYPGGGSHWESLGAVMSGPLSPQKARILTVLAIWASSHDPAGVAATIRAWVERQEVLDD
jgi:hypothetical protein